MLAIDLSELPRLFDKVPFWSARRAAIARFSGKDHLEGCETASLEGRIRDIVGERTGHRPKGRVVLVTHLRYFGYLFNPVSFYYCFDEQDSRMETVLAEVTNTPWRERHYYIIPQKDGGTRCASEFDKAFHVSPFMPMHQRYRWNFGPLGPKCTVHMENYQDETLAFDATLSMARVPLNSWSLNFCLLQFPLMTLQIIWLIYWNALKLWIKGIPFHTHPRKMAGPKGATVYE
jgi:DUF1365 family protein